MNFQLSESNPIYHLVLLGGEIDIHTSVNLEKSLRAIKRQHPRQAVIIDYSAVEHHATPGWSALRLFTKDWSENGGAVLVIGLADWMRESFDWGRVADAPKQCSKWRLLTAENLDAAIEWIRANE